MCLSTKCPTTNHVAQNWKAGADNNYKTLMKLNEKTLNYNFYSVIQFVLMFVHWLYIHLQHWWLCLDSDHSFKIKAGQTCKSCDHFLSNSSLLSKPINKTPPDQSQHLLPWWCLASVTRSDPKQLKHTPQRCQGSYQDRDDIISTSEWQETDEKHRQYHLWHNSDTTLPSLTTRLKIIINQCVGTSTNTLNSSTVTELTQMSPPDVKSF